MYTCITNCCAQSARCKMLFRIFRGYAEIYILNIFVAINIEDERKNKFETSTARMSFKMQQHTEDMQTQSLQWSALFRLLFTSIKRITWIIELWSKHRNLSPAHILSIANIIVHCGLGIQCKRSQEITSRFACGRIYIYILQWMITLLRCLRHLPLCYLVIGYMRSESFQHSSFSFQFGTGYER